MEFKPNSIVRFPSLRESEKRQMLRAYLEKRREIRGNKEPVSDVDADTLLDRTKIPEMVLTPILSLFPIYTETD